MKVTSLLLSLIVVSTRVSPTSAATLTVIPASAQLFEYSSFSLSCKDDEVSSIPVEWTVRRNTSKRLNTQCGKDWGISTGSSCNSSLAVPWDTGVYWCESKDGAASNTINLTVTNGAVILWSPALPVMEGDDVTLSCQSKKTPPSPQAHFYKDDSLIGTEPTGHMTLHQVSKFDEGVYKCSISNWGKSPSSWIRITDKSPPPTSASPPLQLGLTWICHFVVCCPYFISTLLMVSVYCQRPTGEEQERTPQAGERVEGRDFITSVTTEHLF